MCEHCAFLEQQLVEIEDRYIELQIKFWEVMAEVESHSAQAAEHWNHMLTLYRTSAFAQSFGVSERRIARLNALLKRKKHERRD